MTSSTYLRPLSVVTSAPALWPQPASAAAQPASSAAMKKSRHPDGECGARWAEPCGRAATKPLRCLRLGDKADPPDARDLGRPPALSAAGPADYEMRTMKSRAGLVKQMRGPPAASACRGRNQPRRPGLLFCPRRSGKRLICRRVSFIIAQESNVLRPA